MEKVIMKLANFKKMNFSSFKVQIYLLFLMFLTFSISSAQMGCEAEIKVYKNRYIKSVRPSGIFYKMFLTNNSISQDTYTLSSLNVNDSCSNKDGSNTADNVALNLSFLSSNEQPINEITVNSGETISFLVSVTIPDNTNIERWSCNEVIATSQSCTNYTVKTILKNFTLSPSKEE